MCLSPAATSNIDAFLVCMEPEGEVTWARTSTGKATIYPEEVAVGPRGRLAVCGSFHGLGASYPEAPGSVVLEPIANYEMYVAQFDAKGSAVDAEVVGGADTEFGQSVAMDDAGAARASLPPAGLAPQDWHLLVRHRAGSVGSWVRGVRTRNMLLSAGILVALAGSILLLLSATSRARRLGRLQMEFISGVSHELRTPLAVISSAGENLADAVVGDPSRTQEYGRMIHREGRRLGRMVDRVLQFARFQSAPRGLALRNLSPSELIAEALEIYRMEIAERRITVRTEVARNLSPVRGDREALVGALENLVSNAIKYGGDAGEVTIRAAATSLFGRPAVEIGVSDGGPGIPEGERSKVFEPFIRGRAARERQIKGSGLGLSLVREVAVAHGGQVRIDGAATGGALVALILPVETSTASREGGTRDEEAHSSD